MQESVCRNQGTEHLDTQLGRWEKLLSDRDDSRVWKAINWKGEFAGENNGKSCPSNDEFKAHFDAILNLGTDNSDPMEITTDVTIPVLDEQISVEEVQEQIKRMHPDIPCGPNGLPPGVFSLLPAQWVLALYLTTFLCLALTHVHGLKLKCSLSLRKVTEITPIIIEESAS